MQWVEIPHGRKTNGSTFIAVSDTGMHYKSWSIWNKGLTGLEYVKHYKDGVKNQYTKGE